MDLRRKQKRKESQEALSPNANKNLKLDRSSSQHCTEREGSIPSDEQSLTSYDENECQPNKRKRLHEDNGCIQNVKKVKPNSRLPTESVHKGSTISEGLNLHVFLFVLIKYAEELMRKKFNEYVKPENLKEHIEKHRKSLNTLDEVQGKLLFPENGEVSTDNFDVTTLYTLFRRTLESIKPQSGWNVPPEDDHVSLGDDIERIHIIRNFMFHLPLKKEFEKMKKYKETLLQVIDRLGGSVDDATQVLESKTIPKLRVRENETLEKDQNTLLVEKQWKEEDMLYFETHSFRRIWTKMRRCKNMLIIGGPGVGKKALIQHCALKLQTQGFTISQLSNPSELKSFAKKKEKQVFVMENLYRQGLKDNFFLDDSIILKDSSLKLHKDSIILMTIRKDVFIRANDYSEFLRSHAGILDLDESQFSLNLSDKRGIFENHSKRNEKLLPIDFSEVESNCFPALVKMFCNTKKCQERGVDFFHKPYEFYLKELNTIKREDRIAYTALVVLLFDLNSHSAHANLFSQILEECEVKFCLESLLSLLRSFKRLTGTFIVEDEEGYEFANEIIEHVIAYDFGKGNPELCIRYMSIDYVASNILIGNKRKSEVPNLKVDKTHFRVLANRIYAEVRNLEILHAFKAKCWLNENFSEYFIQFLKKKPFREVKSLFWGNLSISSDEEKGEEIMEEIYDSLFELFEKDLKLSSIPEILKVFYLLSPKEMIDSETVNIFPSLEMWKLVAKGCSSEELAICFLKDRFGRAWNSKLRTVKWRINLMRPIVAFGLNSLFCYVLERSKKLKKSFCKMFCPTEHEKRVLFYLGCLSGSRKISETIIKNIPIRKCEKDVFEEGMFAACFSGSTGIISLLYKEMEKRNLNYKGNITLLHVAYVMGDIKVIKTLRRFLQWDDNNVDKGELLIHACSGGHKKLVQDLIDEGANVNRCIEHGVSPLYQATVTNNLGIIELLCEHGADPTMRTEFKSSPLLYAKSLRKIDIVSYLENIAIPRWKQEIKSQ